VEEAVMATVSPASVPCPACSSTDTRRFLVRDVNRGNSPESFAYRRCRRCRLTFIENIPPDLWRFYEGEYHSIPTTVADLEKQASAEQFKIDFVDRFARGRRLLEIGPSFGAFAHLAKRAGYDVGVVETDPACCRFLREHVGVRVFEAVDPVDSISTSGPYDAIAMWQVFEHLPNPWAVLRAAAAALNDGGIVVVATPNPESLQHRFWGTRWTHFDAPRHLELVPIDVLCSAGEKVGLQLVHATTTDAGSLGWNAFGWAHSMAGLTRRAALKGPLKLAGRLMSVPFRPVERSGWRGACYTAVLRKGG
jgi:2-polyprenyl-3-methyl-5-hydroxy-6-metoxy-1,4-benzoquinol methylase